LQTPQSLVIALSRTRLRSVFNPYADRCTEYDRHDAARIRRRNLVRYLEAALEARVETMWIARDLGYRSGRRTGIPITDQIRLEQAGALFGGIQLIAPHWNHARDGKQRSLQAVLSARDNLSMHRLHRTSAFCY